MNVLKITYAKDHDGYAANEEAAWPLEQAAQLVAKGVARFNDPADTEKYAAEVAAAAARRPAPWVRQWYRVKPEDRRWG